MESTKSIDLIYHELDPVPECGDEGKMAHPPGRWHSIPSTTPCAQHDTHCRWRLHLPGSYRNDLLSALRKAETPSDVEAGLLCDAKMPEVMGFDGEALDPFVHCNHVLQVDDVRSQIGDLQQQAVMEAVMWIGAAKLGLFPGFIKLQLTSRPHLVAFFVGSLVALLAFLYCAARCVVGACAHMHGNRAGVAGATKKTK